MTTNKIFFSLMTKKCVGKQLLIHAFSLSTRYAEVRKYSSNKPNKIHWNDGTIDLNLILCIELIEKKTLLKYFVKSAS